MLASTLPDRAVIKDFIAAASETEVARAGLPIAVAQTLALLVIRLESMGYPRGHLTATFRAQHGNDAILMAPPAIFAAPGHDDWRNVGEAFGVDVLAGMTILYVPRTANAHSGNPSRIHLAHRLSMQ